MSKKIVFLSNSFWNFFNFRIELITYLIQNGYDLYLIAPKDQYINRISAVTSLELSFEPNGINPLKDILTLRKFYKEFKRIKPDVIFSFTIKPNIYGSIAASLLKIPIINNITGLGVTFLQESIIKNIVIYLYRISLKESAHIFFQNYDDQKIFLNHKILKNQSNSIIPGSGVDTNHFVFDRIKNNGTTYLFVGRVLKDKGIVEFIEAAKIISTIKPEIIFLIAGSINNSNSSSLNQKTFESYLSKALNIKYLGDCVNIKDVLREADVLVLPSYREGLSKALIEACAMSLPIITTDVPGCRDVVSHKFNGLLCTPRSTQDLAKKILEMNELSESERLQFGKNSRELAELKFSNTNIVEINTSILKKILKTEV